MGRAQSGDKKSVAKQKMLKKENKVRNRNYLTNLINHQAYFKIKDLKLKLIL